MSRRSIEEYQVGWVCALPKELTAARAMLDEEHEEFQSRVAQDNNSYVLGRVHEHNVVMACLPAGMYGTNSAATVANNMLRTFTGLRFGLMVGIGGGIPNLKKGWDIRLGDVVVSQPDGTHGGVVQYDLGKNLGEGIFELKGFLRPPPTLLLTALANLQSRHSMYGNQISDTLSNMIKRLPRLAKSGYVNPGLERDSLHCSNVQGHQETRTCSQCQNRTIHREPREDQSPEVHYGIIASGNELMKNVVERDRLSRESGAKCIEMEAAGLMNDFPCIVIRGICDYADSHKNDVWQEYAAATAAAFAKELLHVVKPTDVTIVKYATEVTKYNLGLNLFDAPDMGRGLFTGRQPEIQEMEKILQAQSASTGSIREVLILGGMGGIGKTQLAITYAKQHHSSYSSIFWLNASSEVAMTTSLRALANRIISPETVSKLKDDQLWIHVSNWLSELENTRWLLVFDDYDDPDQYNIKTYYPFATHGSIIVTTRQPRLLNGGQLKVESMKRMEDSLQILATRSRRDHVKSDPNARKLAERLDGHPLALATAGAFLKESSVSFAEYLQQYEAKWKVIDSIEKLPDYPARTLFTTWNLSFEQIQRENMKAAWLLKFFAYLDNRDIWYDLLCGAGKDRENPGWFIDSVGDKFMFESVMQVLTKYCLVETSHETGSYSLHVCVHDWTLNDLNQEVETTFYRLALNCLSCHVPASDWDNLSSKSYTRFTPHATRLAHSHFMTILDQQHFSQNEFAKFEPIAELLYRKGQFTASESIMQLLLTSKEQALGPDHSSTLATVNNLGSLYKNQGKLGEAERMYQRALAGYEQALGPDHSSTLDTVNNLGSLYMDQGKLGEAERMYQRALAGKEQALGPDHSSTLNTVNNLGLLYNDQGKLDEAERMYQRALAGYEQALGPDHSSTLNTVNNLGSLYMDQGKLGEAERMYQRALAGKEQALGPDHSSTLDTVNNLGLLYNDQGKLDEAERMYQRALAGYEQALGPDHSSTLATVNNLGILYNDQCKLGEAERMYQRALAGYEQALGPDHSSTLNTVNNLGSLYMDQGKLGEAERMYQRALAGKEQALGPDHSSTLDTVNNLGLLYNDQGKLDEAERMYQRALVGYENALQPETIPALNTVSNLARLYRDQGKTDEAENMFQRATKGRKKVLGSDHPDTLEVVNA